MIPTLEELKGLSRQQKIRALEALKKMPSAPSSTSALVSREDPRQFILEVLGEVPTPAAIRHGIKVPWTPDQDRIFQSVVDNRKTIVQSANSVGKTAAAARICLWWIYRRPGSIVITTAPNKRQVEELLWGEIRALWHKSKVKLPGRILQTKLIVDENSRWFAIGHTARSQVGDFSSTEFSGMHGPFTLAILDESPAIAATIPVGIDGMLTSENDRQLALGNPTLSGGWFDKATKSAAWNRIVVDALDHPNVKFNDAEIIPGAATRVWVESCRLDWGEESPLWQAKVRGQWPDQASDKLIRIEFLEAAQNRWIEANEDACRQDDKKGIAAGLDIAGEGVDLTVLSTIENGSWEIPMANGHRTFHSGKDVDKAVDLVLDVLSEGRNIRILTLDDTGLGQGVTAALRKLQRSGKIRKFNEGGMWINPVNFARTAWDHDRFDWVTDELWWQARMALQERDFLLPPDSEIEKWGLPKGNSLLGQLQTPIYENVRQGVIAVYDKRGRRGRREKTINLPEKSPDLAHSFILCVHSWLKLRADAKEPPAETTVDIFARKMRKIIQETSVRRGDAKDRMAPWMRARRR
jgi:phage terminase large subunit